MKRVAFTWGNARRTYDYDEEAAGMILTPAMAKSGALVVLSKMGYEPKPEEVEVIGVEDVGRKHMSHHD